jgi:2,3-bisphosphoglycerate-independent phosphoglycerate mutase
LNLQGINQNFSGNSMIDSQHQTSIAGPLVLMVLDGWGYREDAADNANSQANTPNWDQINNMGCNTTDETSGEFVG